MRETTMAIETTTRIEIVEGNITKQAADALVNAANESLLGGGGVDGAIHRAAGPELLEECRKLNGCPTGEAKITHGYNLPAKWVIHTVGPVWRGGKNNANELLANCYRNSLKLAVKHGIKTIAFPSISTGLYRFPVEQAARIALTETQQFLEENKTVEKVIFVCYGHDAFSIYLQVAREVMPDYPG
jgi:O-acetyl-ADP-ribose deacetylase (regulator of RNase III)